MSVEQKQFITTQGLKDRGWTKMLIDRHLGEPDSTRANPNYRAGPPIRLYLLERVLAVEQGADWAGLVPKSSRNKRAAAQARQADTRQGEAR